MMIGKIEVSKVTLLRIEQRTPDVPSVIMEERLPESEKADFFTVVELDGMSCGAPMLKSAHGGDWIVGADTMPYELLIEMEPGSKLFCEGHIRFRVRKSV